MNKFIEKMVALIFIFSLAILLLTFASAIMVIQDIHDKGGLPTVVGEWVKEYEQAKSQETVN